MIFRALLHFFDWVLERLSQISDPPAGSHLSCHYGELDLTRKVFPSGYSWEVIRQDTGDIDVLPLGEDHGRGPGCSCNPRVDVEGGYLVTVHNSFDHREIVEEAINIMNGVDNAESG